MWAPVTVVMAVVVLGLVALILRYKAKGRQIKERMFLAEKGLPIPPELYDHKPPKAGDYRATRIWLILLGLLCIFIGFGAGLVATVNEGIGDGIGGLVAILIGVALLITERMIRRHFIQNNGSR
jgi:hypothetical protein